MQKDTAASTVNIHYCLMLHETDIQLLPMY